MPSNSSGKKKVHKLKRSPQDTGRVSPGHLPGQQGSTSRCPRDFLLFSKDKLALLPGHRPGVLGTLGRPGGVQKSYVIFSYVPSLLSSSCLCAAQGNMALDSRDRACATGVRVGQGEHPLHITYSSERRGSNPKTPCCGLIPGLARSKKEGC